MHKTFCCADSPQRKRKEGREERLRFKTEKRETISEEFESMLQEAEKTNLCDSHRSEVDFARQQIAKSYLTASISEVD